MARFFVRDEDRIHVKVYVAENENGSVDAGLSPSELNSNNQEVLTFTFRRPKHQDSLAVLAASRVAETGVTDFVGLQAAILRQLLVDWDIKDEEGKNIPFSKASISNLEPSIARSAATGFLDVVNI